MHIIGFLGSGARVLCCFSRIYPFLHFDAAAHTVTLLVQFFDLLLPF